MSELSGSQWCARFPGSRSVNDLAVPLRNSVVAFLNALDKAAPPDRCDKCDVTPPQAGLFDAPRMVNCARPNPATGRTAHEWS
jgi:hypothetical protein